MTVMTYDQRKRETREKLEQIKEMGYRYIATSDDGETWEGSRQTGLEIEDLMHHDFLGNIALAR